MPENIQMICLVRLIVAAVCGLLIGVGAAGVSVDVSRVAASIAAGIGFLGAGVIFVHRSGVVGLTDGKRRPCASVRLAGAEENHRARDRSQAAGRHFDKADFLRLQEDITGVQSVEI